MGLQHISSIQKRHDPIRLNPDLVPRVRRDDIESSDVHAKLSRLGEFAETGTQAKDVGAGDGGGEVGHAEGEVVDARVVKAKDGTGARGGGGGGRCCWVIAGGCGGGGINEVCAGAAGVVGECGEESASLIVCERPDDWWSVQ